MNQESKSQFNFLSLLLIAITIIIIAVGSFFFFKSSKEGVSETDNNPSLVDSPGGTSVDDVFGESNDEGEEPSEGLVIELSDGSPQDQSAEAIRRVTGDPLTEEEIAAIISRLPDIGLAPAEQVAFKLPGDPIPPPRPGQTIEQEFPQNLDSILPDPVDPGPLEVLRFAPVGDVGIAPTINITFNQAVVPLGTLAQLNKEDVPVIIQPEIPGSWSWIGTRSLAFHFDSELIDRLPMATEFQVTIPSGVSSASGNLLAEEVSWTFTTPPPTLISYYPTYSPQPLDPFFFIAFDQRIDPEAVIATINTTADNRPFEIGLSDQADYGDEKEINRLIDRTPEGRWMVFQALEPLPKDADINIQIGPETPSAEGPKVTAAVQGYSFRTYSPLDVNEHGCSWYGDECYPMSPFNISFNNPIDPDAYQEEMISIDPVIPGASISIAGRTITISGPTQGSTTYRVTLDASLTDTFGQQLGRDVKLNFRVGKAEPRFFGPDSNLVTLDPASTSPVLSLYTINYSKLDVKIYSVEPSDWTSFLEYVQQYSRTDQPTNPPGRLVLDDTIQIDAANDVLTEVGINLKPVMDGDYGHFVIIAKPPKGFFEEDRYWEHVQVWVQVTQIGIDAISDQNELVVWTTDLQTGAPLENIEINNGSISRLASTNENGTARFEIPSSGITYLTAQKGRDVAILPQSPYYYSNGWQPSSDSNDLRWYIFDDRAIYRPGEEVHVKGWMRLIESGPEGDVRLVGDNIQSVSYTVWGPQGNELATGSTAVSALGGFDFKLTLPDNVNLGFARIELYAAGNIPNTNSLYTNHNFQIQEFRRPEFEVIARNETTGPYFVDGEAEAAVSAEYYAGGPLPGAEVNWYVTSSETTYHPPNWTDFTFGTWTPWWWRAHIYEGDFYYDGYDSGPEGQSFAGKTDATGNHYLKMSFHNLGEPAPYSVVANASVMDVNNQAWAGTTSLLVHPADLYVGLRSAEYFVDQGTPLVIDLIVTDLDGNPVTGKVITASAARLEWKYQGGKWQEVEVNPQRCEITSEIEPVSCIFETPMGGRYQISAMVTDDLGRKNQSQFTRWVSGGKLPPSREVELQKLDLIPDKETYQPGETAKVLVQAPFSPAEGLLTVTRSGILYTERFVIQENGTTLLIPIEEAHIPNINIQVDLVGSSPRIDSRGEEIEGIPEQPAFASAQLTLSVPPLDRTLSVEIKPRETKLAPGEDTTIDILLTDADGKPVSDAEFSLVVVDEAVLALTNYQLTDPISIFYYTRSAGTSTVYGRSSIILVNPQLLNDQAAQAPMPTGQAFRNLGGETDGTAVLEMAAPAMDMAEDEAVMAKSGPQDSGNAIDIRTDFNPLAIFSPDERTSLDGTASVKVSLPDNLTRYRIMVVAVDERGNRFGSAESSLTARLPLMVRPSASRFLNYGDQFEMPVVLQNQTDEAMTVDLVAEAGNLTFTGNQGVRVTIPANDRISVYFPGTTDSAGDAVVRFAGVSGENADAATVSLPVYTPATTEAFATYGVVDKGAILQPILSPEDVIPVYGGLEITTSSTALQALTDAVLYLSSYPFYCSEQIASRVLGIAALRDVLEAFEAEGLPSPEELEAQINRDIADLKKLQNYDGGFPYWRRGRDSVPFNSVHVAHALQRARMMGFEVPEQMWQNALNYLTHIEDHYPYWYGERTKQTISAYALFVRMQMDDSDPSKAAALLRDAGIEEISLEGLSWLWQVLSTAGGYEDMLVEIRQHVNNRVVETPGAANFTTSYGDDAYLLLHSNRRTDALLLDALIADNPESDLIPKVVTGLLAHRTQGRWHNTQENVFVLLAMDRYFDAFESVEPDFIARIWLGDDYVAASQFEGYSANSYQLDVPMSFLINSIDTEGQQDIIIQKDGDGRLYYRLGLRYAPLDLQLDPVDMGFVIQRVYEAVDNPDDVIQDSDGIWHIKAGARVRVRVTMVADNRRYHVALVDPLPAGLEIINPGLAVSESLPPDSSDNKTAGYWYWWWTWYEHQNLRDERAEAFTSRLWEGVYEYTYVTRATMPGTFIVPPAKAEEMYSPEVFGRSGSDIVIVEAETP
ncbi:MAG: Ig-like domain-containing protein [Chloroflexota bacterium]